MAKQDGGQETYNRLSFGCLGQTKSERLASHILRSEGYESNDPSHPLGGRDGGRDIVCKKDGQLVVGACYFPNEPQIFRSVKEKFRDDLTASKKHNPNVIAFMTNQKLTLSERDELKNIAKENNIESEIYHLERIASILDTPSNYGIRREFLGIDMSQEEMLAYHAYRDEQHYKHMDELNKKIDDIIGYTTGKGSFLYIANNRTGEAINNDILSFVAIHQGKYPVYDIKMTVFGEGGIIHNEAIDVVVPKSPHFLGFKINAQGKKTVTLSIQYSSRGGHFVQSLDLYKADNTWLSNIDLVQFDEGPVFTKNQYTLKEN